MTVLARWSETESTTCPFCFIVFVLRVTAGFYCRLPCGLQKVSLLYLISANFSYKAPQIFLIQTPPNWFTIETIKIYRMYHYENINNESFFLSYRSLNKTRLQSASQDKQNVGDKLKKVNHKYIVRKYKLWKQNKLYTINQESPAVL